MKFLSKISVNTTVNYDLNIAGDGQIAGSLGVGTAPIANTVLSAIGQTTDPSAAIYGMRSTVYNIASAGSNGQTTYGCFNSAAVQGPFDFTGAVYGALFSAQSNLTSGGKTSTMISGYFRSVTANDSAVTICRGGAFAILHNSTGNISTAQGAYIGNWSAVGTYTNVYGHYIDTLPAGTTATWGLYINGAHNNYVRQAIYIGNGGNAATPTVPLDVNGAIRIRAVTVGTLPTASVAGEGSRHHVTDSTVPYSGANVGYAVVGGGTNKSPVKVVNGVWVIG